MDIIAVFSTPEAWISIATLTALEIVLGVDNIVFISILSSKLPQDRQHRARRLGLGFALLTRIGLLFVLSWFMGLTEPLFTVLEHPISVRDLILLAGGLFLIGKSVFEIYEKLEVEHPGSVAPAGSTVMAWLIVQIMLLDIVFSLDSVITAVGMVQHVEIMITAMIIAMVVMLLFAGPVGDFINRHPSMKVLALAFLLLIGVLLVAESLGQHVNKGYIYFAMAFSLGVELVNMRVRGAHSRGAEATPAPPALGGEPGSP